MKYKGLTTDNREELQGLLCKHDFIFVIFDESQRSARILQAIFTDERENLKKKWDTSFLPGKNSFVRGNVVHASQFEGITRLTKSPGKKYCLTRVRMRVDGSTRWIRRFLRGKRSQHKRCIIG